jgi:cold-inducible RNA-binding protein
VNIYVGNLPHETTETELKDAFQAYGEVSTINIIKDRFSGEPRGFGFVEMPSKEQAAAAIAEMNGKQLHGRALTVNEAKPKTEGRDRSSGGGGGRGGFSRGPSGGGGGGGRRNW